MTDQRISNVNTLADYIDRLIVEVNKLSWLEAQKHAEHKQDNPDLGEIARLDRLSRACCNLRSVLKNKINETLQEIVRTGRYEYLREVKTFGKPPVAFDDALADRCHDIGDLFARDQMTGALARELKRQD